MIPRTITPEKVAAIRRYMSNGSSIREAARKARVSYFTARNVVTGYYDGYQCPPQPKRTRFFQVDGINWITGLPTTHAEQW